MLSLRHLQIFRTVAESGTFTRAAERLYITQSAVSHVIRELEDQAGTALFERTARQVRLTGAGRLLLADALPILSACERLEARLDRLERQAPIRVVSCITIAAFRLPELLRSFQTAWPDAEVRVEVASAAAALAVLRTGRADVALLEGARPEGPFCSTVFSSYALEAVCAPSYPAAGRRLTPEALCAERLLLREPGSAVRDTLDSALYLSGLAAEPVWTSVNSQALLAAARAGLGVAVLPDGVVADAAAAGDLVRVRLAGLELRNELLTVRRADQPLTAPMEALLSVIEGGG